MNSDEIINSIIKPFVVEQPYEVPGEFYMSSYLDEFEEEARSCKHYECPYKCCAYHWNRLDELGRVRYLEEYPIVAEGFPIGIDDIKNCQLYLNV